MTTNSSRQVRPGAIHIVPLLWEYPVSSLRHRSPVRTQPNCVRPNRTLLSNDSSLRICFSPYGRLAILPCPFLWLNIISGGALLIGYFVVTYRVMCLAWPRSSIKAYSPTVTATQDSKSVSAVEHLNNMQVQSQMAGKATLLVESFNNLGEICPLPTNPEKLIILPAQRMRIENQPHSRSWNSHGAPRCFISIIAPATRFIRVHGLRRLWTCKR
jgi:hypothetical protein